MFKWIKQLLGYPDCYWFTCALCSSIVLQVKKPKSFKFYSNTNISWCDRNNPICDVCFKSLEEAGGRKSCKKDDKDPRSHK